MSTNKKIRLFKIYALIHENNVFIGKTQGEIDPVYYQHRRAENSFTEEYFYPKNSKNPSIHILERINCNSSESYRHIVAWVRIFQDAGYQIINAQGTVEDANDLHPQTAKLINTLHPISLSVLLKETRYKKQDKRIPSPITEPSETEQPKKTKSSEKITLWATSEEKELFVTYAKSLGLTQTQTLRYLMSKVHLEEADPLFPAWDNDTFIHILQELHRQEIESKDNEIHKLKTALRISVEEKHRQTKKLNNCCAIAQKSLIDAYGFFDSAAVLPLDIERGRYKDYISKLPEDTKYSYPTHSDASLLRLQAVLLGEGIAPARFVLGVDQQGCRIKLRYYPSDYFWGIRPDNQRFSQRNSVWYMAWRKSADVAELISALPLQISTKYLNPMDGDEKMHKFIEQLMLEIANCNDL